MAKKKTKKITSLYELKEDMIEDLAIAVENDEVANDPLEDLEKANGKIEEEIQEELEASEEPNLDELEYADGKERDELDLVEEQEKIYGTNKLSPFKTADIRLFRRNLETMSNEKMIAIAERVAARIYSDPKSQKEELERAFVSWASRNTAFQTDMTKKAEKGARSEAFGNSASVNDLEEKLKTQSLSDLQATAARLGFNPGFDRNRLITLIKQEYQRQS